MMERMPEPINLPPKEPLNSIQKTLLECEVIESIREIYDPEIPVNIYDLGLIYGIEVSDAADVVVTMTLTSPACPVAESLPVDVELRVAQTPGVANVRVDLVWDPPFTIDRIPDHVRLDLGLL